MGWGMLIAGAIAAGGAAYMSSSSQNDAREAQIGAYKNLPNAPDFTESYREGWNEQQEELVKTAMLEQQMRQAFLPGNAKLSADIYRQWAPHFAQTNLKSLEKVDPNFVNGRRQLGSVVSEDLARGSSLDPAYSRELEQYMRAAQADRGNVFGNAPANAEALYEGSAGLALKQQRIANMMNYLSGPSISDKFGNVGGGAGNAALGTLVGAAATPGNVYTEKPTGWADAYMRAAGAQFDAKRGNALSLANATAQAPAEQSPWMAALIGALGSVAGSAGAGGMGGGMGGAGGAAGAAGHYGATYMGTGTQYGLGTSAPVYRPAAA